MANAYDSGAGSFEMTRLRTADASFLAGVDRPRSLPDPIAIATGPFITGPQANAVGASEWWVAGASMVVSPDICWVMVQAQVHLRKEPGTNEPEGIYLAPRGSVTNGAYLEGPILGPGPNINAFTGASGGTAPEMAGYAGQSGSMGMWLPLDPAWTAYAFEVIASIYTNAAGGFAQNGVKLDMRQVKLIGYPANVWGTGALHAVAAYRGS